jgi:hypothetical protein
MRFVAPTATFSWPASDWLNGNSIDASSPTPHRRAQPLESSQEILPPPPTPRSSSSAQSANEQVVSATVIKTPRPRAKIHGFRECFIEAFKNADDAPCPPLSPPDAATTKDILAPFQLGDASDDNHSAYDPHEPSSTFLSALSVFSENEALYGQSLQIVINALSLVPLLTGDFTSNAFDTILSASEALEMAATSCELTGNVESLVLALHGAISAYSMFVHRLPYMICLLKRSSHENHDAVQAMLDQVRGVHCRLQIVIPEYLEKLLHCIVLYPTTRLFEYTKLCLVCELPCHHRCSSPVFVAITDCLRTGTYIRRQTLIQADRNAGSVLLEEILPSMHQLQAIGADHKQIMLQVENLEVVVRMHNELYLVCAKV